MEGRSIIETEEGDLSLFMLILARGNGPVAWRQRTNLSKRIGEKKPSKPTYFFLIWINHSIRLETWKFMCFLFIQIIIIGDLVLMFLNDKISIWSFFIIICNKTHMQWLIKTEKFFFFPKTKNFFHLPLSFARFFIFNY